MTTIATLRRICSTSLLARLTDAPGLVAGLRALPPASFSALVRRIGVEDAGVLLALATTEQLVAAFDEDLFGNAAPGERETFDASRFATWLEALLEGGDAAVAARFVELSPDFAVQALSSLVWVFDDDALRDRMADGGDEAEAADKALESTLSESIDGYLLVARDPLAFDAVMSLVLALDRDHRDHLVRLLDRCVTLSDPLLDDLDELASRLSESESLAEDVEAEREERRSALGYVEPRAAKSFLALAREPLVGSAGSAERDPITRAYFRDLERRPAALPDARGAATPETERLLAAASDVAEDGLAVTPAGASAERGATRLVLALRALEELDGRAFVARLEELAYLANVLMAGAGTSEARLGPAEAAEAAMATVALGALLEAGAVEARPDVLTETLRACSADRLFRRASGALGAKGFVRSEEEVAAHVRLIREESGSVDRVLPARRRVRDGGRGGR